MCGIVGYVGPNADGKALDVVMEGLARLEYRGYDSAGVALVTADGVFSEKRAGKLVNLEGALDADELPS
ncbi:MAG: glutamine--fructose-6-phosphate aminotransferase, partial [Terrabacter sp.]|nr:glutamine--fructose-6-phosphate aminotransferase [Terrabacter sp.]